MTLETEAQSPAGVTTPRAGLAISNGRSGGRVNRMLALVGPRPADIGGYLLYQVSQRVSQRLLRATYARRVLTPGRVGIWTPWPFQLVPARELPEPLRAEATRLRDEADYVCAHRFDVLGSGL